jgi:hypothetical protein
MPNIKISELDPASAVGSSVVPVSDVSGTITNKVTLQDIADLKNTYDSAVPWTANHTLADGTRYLVNDLVYESGYLYKANFDNESIPVSSETYWTNVGVGYRLNIDGRDIPNIPYPVDSVNGQTGDVELSTTDLDDFNTAVSGLLPVKDIISGTGISVSSASGVFTIATSGVSLDGHTHIASDITDFNSSVSGLLPVKDIIAGTGVAVSSVSGVYTIDAIEVSRLATTAFNKTGSVIPKMSVVYINGGQGDMPTITLAIANGESGSSKTYGITAEAIGDMSSGKVIVEGALTGLNTDQFNPTSPTGNVNGTVVYLSPTVAGGITTTKPSAPNHLVAVGTIVRTHQNEGVIEVRIQNGFELQELHNVKINGVAHQDILVYNSGNSLWENNSNAVFSNVSGITGSITINNIVAISQANYDGLGSYDPNTIYYIV